MATCADCHRDLARGDRYMVLENGTVYHRQCLLARILRDARKIRDLSAENQRLRLEKDTQRDEIAALRERLSEVHIIRDQLRRLQSEAAQLRLEMHGMDVELAQADHDVEAMRRERDAARSEAALHQTLAQPVPQPTGGIFQLASDGPVTVVSGTPEQETKKDARDDTEIRFSLLEIDLP